MKINKKNENKQTKKDNRTIRSMKYKFKKMKKELHIAKEIKNSSYLTRPKVLTAKGPRSPNNHNPRENFSKKFHSQKYISSNLREQSHMLRRTISSSCVCQHSMRQFDNSRSRTPERNFHYSVSRDSSRYYTSSYEQEFRSRRSRPTTDSLERSRSPNFHNSNTRIYNSRRRNSPRNDYHSIDQENNSRQLCTHDRRPYNYHRQDYSWRLSRLPTYNPSSRNTSSSSRQIRSRSRSPNRNYRR